MQRNSLSLQQQVKRHTAVPEQAPVEEVDTDSEGGGAASDASGHESDPEHEAEQERRLESQVSRNPRLSVGV